MRQVLVLGASGFIGRQCVEKLLTYDDLTVHSVSRAIPGWAKRLISASDSRRLVWHEQNLLDFREIQPLVFKIKPAYALHTAWYAGHGTIWTTPDNLDWTAVTLSLARALVTAGCKRLVITGSCAEYSGAGVFAESAVCVPETLYGKSKSSSRLLVETLCRGAEVSFAWPRLFHMYGPHENAKRLIAGAINALIDGQAFACSDGRQVRDFLHVADVGDVLVKLLFSDVEGIINLGSGQPVALADLLTTVGRLLRREELIVLGARPRGINDPDRLVPDVTRQTDELRWTPGFSAETGLANTVAWWRAQRGLSHLEPACSS